MCKQPIVNIIIVTYNEFQYTEKCVESLLVDGYKNKKIILVDNASEASEYKKFRDRIGGHGNVIFVRSEKNLGFGGGCNLGIEQVSEGYIVFLNNDTEVENGWIEPIVDYMEKHPEVGACQPKIRSLRDKEYFEYAGAAGGLMDIYGYPFTRGRIFFDLEKDNGQYDNIAELVWCSGTAMVTKKSVLDEVGWFDDIFFMYGEESDLCWRIYRSGRKLVFVPQSTVFHYGMGTMGKEKSSKKAFFHHRNGLILLLKNYSFLELVYRLPVRMLLDIVTFWYYIFIYAPNSWSVVRAYFSLLRILPWVMAHRTADAKKVGFPKSGSGYPLYKRSIVWDYFILKKRRFSDLYDSFVKRS